MDSIDKSNNTLSIYHQKTPSSIEELYSVTLPEIRSKLKKKGLKQVGYIKPISEEEFQENKYQMMGIQHNPFSPIALEDPSLKYFQPR